MYAIVSSGGRQYRVEPGQRLDVEKFRTPPGTTRPSRAEAGSEVTLDQVLLIGDGESITVGQPTVSGARVLADVVGEVKGRKIIVFKYKNKVRYRRKTGHRQRYLRLQIKEIQHGS